MREVDVQHDAMAEGWTVQITYSTQIGERTEPLERQRGGPRAFATLDALSRCVAGLGLTRFRVNTTGLTRDLPL